MVTKRDVTIDGSEAKIPLRIYTPDRREVDGVVVYYHWGGFVSGGLDESDPECMAVSSICGCTVVSVGYRLAPSYRFPAAVVDAFDALKWVVEHAGEIGGSGSKVAVMGTSAGGNLAAVVSVLARDSGIRLRFQVLITPVIGFDPYSTSARLYGRRGFDLDMDAIYDFTIKYLGDLSRAYDPRFTPILADLRNLPPALIITAENDALRDQGEMYAEMLRRAGVRVISIRMNGVGHSLSPEYWRVIQLLVGSVLREELR